jgi:cobalt transporter subunit CbtA
MFKRLLTSALFAGFAAGLLAAVLQYALVERLILLAEDYETGALVHFQGTGDHAAAPAQDHDHAAPEAGAAAAGEASEPAAHDHGAAAEGEPSGLARHGLTVLFAVLTYTGFALLLVAGYAFAEERGIRLTVRDGLLWGLAGFAAVQLAPALGLEPELPGTPAADLTARQLWWFGTLVATAGGLALLAYGRGIVLRIAGLVLLAAPHLIGAPDLGYFAGSVPPELASSFAARSLAVGLVAWVTLGGLLAWLWSNERL